MKKLFPLIVLLTFAVSGCTLKLANPQEAASNVLGDAVTYSEFLNSKPNDREFYEDAFIQAEAQRPIQKPIKAGLLPFDTTLSPEIGAYFQRLLRIGPEVETVILVAGNYGPADRHARTTTLLPYKTPYGVLEPETAVIEGLIEDWRLFDAPDTFKREKAIGFFAPYIKKTFPNAKIIPVLVEGTLPPEQSEYLGTVLAEATKDKKTVLLSVSNFSNHPQLDLARFQTRFARSSIEAGDFHNLFSLNLDSIPSVYVLKGFIDTHKSYETIFQAKGMTTPIDPTQTKPRGYIMEYFLDGEPTPTPEATLIAVGDIMLDRYVRTLMERYGEDYPFEKISPQGLLRSAHITLANFEGPVADERPRVGDVIFKFDPWMIDLIKRHGINLVTIANNHTLDQGQKGLDDTKRHLNEKNLDWIGHPLNETEGHTLIKEINGLQIGFIGLHDATIRLDDTIAIEAIESMRPNVDTLIVTIHWGPEYVPASQRQKDLGHAFIDAGADAVIGHHPHIEQEIELYNDKPIIYSLGNFIFDQYWSQATQKALSVGLIFSPNQVELYRFPIVLPASQPSLVID